MGKTTTLEAENAELKEKLIQSTLETVAIKLELDDLHKWINQGGGKK
jgi:hypothetical protein